MYGRFRRIISNTAAAALLACAGTAVFAQAAIAELDLPQQSLANSLRAVATATHVNVLFDTAQIAVFQAPALKGRISIDEALSRLLAGTGLTHRFIDAKTVVLARPTTDATQSVRPLSRNSGSGELRLAQADTSAPSTQPDSQAPGSQAQSITLDEIVVEASKMGSTVVRTPQSVSVLSGADIELRGVQNLTDALRYIPGAVPENYGYEGRGYEWLLLRGFDATYTGNYRDGLNQAVGWFATPYTEPYNVERLEVLRGPSSSLFGRSDAGGIINRVSKRPDPNAPSEFIAEFGNFERRKIGMDFGGALNAGETLSYRWVSTVTNSGAQRKYSNGERPTNTAYFVAPSLLWRVSDDTSITLLTDFRKNRNKGYSYSVTSPDGSYNGVLVADPGFTRYDDLQGSVGYRFEHRFNDAWELRQNFRFSHVEAQVDDIYAAGFEPDERTLNRYTIKSDDWLDQTHVDTNLQGEFQTGSVQQTVLLGVDVSRQHWDLLFFDGAAPTLDILAPVYGQPVDHASTLSLDMATKTELTGAYAQYQAQFDERWILTLGSRYDWARVTTDDDAAALTTLQRDEAFTLRAGLSYAMSNGLVPYLSYSESFLPQGGADVAGTPFEPTRGEQLEAGVKYQPANFRGIFTVAVFDVAKTNVITADPDNYGYSYTKGQIDSRGVELEGRFEVLDGVDVSTSYTYLDVEVAQSNDDEGMMPIQIPDRMANLWVDYARFTGALSGLTLSGGVRHVGKRFDDTLNTQSSDPYTLFDLGARYERGPWQYALNAVNAFDKRYIQSRAWGAYSLGYERTVSATVKYRW